MSNSPAQLALWYEEAAEVLQIAPDFLLEKVGSRVCFKRDLVGLAEELGLDQTSRERLEAALPGERGRG